MPDLMFVTPLVVTLVGMYLFADGEAKAAIMLILISVIANFLLASFLTFK